MLHTPASLSVETAVYNGQDLFKLVPVEPLPGLPEFFNLQFRRSRTVPSTALKGPGVYVVAFKNMPVYLGKYMGKQIAPFAGNVSDLRWSKHIATLTLRGKRISLAKRTLHMLRDDNHPLSNSLQDASADMLHNERGCVTTLPRVLFAQQHWNAFYALDKHTLADFSFHYVRVAPSHDTLPTALVRSHVSNVEDSLIQCFPLLCNAKSVNAQQPPSDASLEEVMSACRAALSDLSDIGDEHVSTLDYKSLASFKSGTASEPTPLLHKQPAAPESESKSESLKQKPDQITDEPDDDHQPLFQQTMESVKEDWAHAFVQTISEHFERNAMVEVHYTSANKRGDLRLRIYWSSKDGQLKSQNFATLVWQPQEQRFLIRTEASVKTAQALNMHIGNDTLPAGLHINEALYRSKARNILRALEDAALLIQVRQRVIHL